jgi:hypothetical protein
VSDYITVNDTTLRVGEFVVGVGPDGSVTRLSAHGREFADDARPLFALLYQSFDEQSFEAFLDVTCQSLSNLTASEVHVHHPRPVMGVSRLWQAG